MISEVTLAAIPALWMLYLVASKISLVVRKRRYTRDHGCLPLRGDGDWDPIFDLHCLFETLDAARKNRLLYSIHKKYQMIGTSFHAPLLQKDYIYTIDPKNIQTILAIKFSDFELGDERKTAVKPLLGQGIFASDGTIWEHSKALVRPNFVRNQIADMGVYESHVAHLIDTIPRDGSTVDLQELFFRMTLDSATEFLFGESVGSLLNSASASRDGFAADFNTALDGLAFRIRIGFFNKIYRDREFDRSIERSRLYVGQFVQKGLKYRAELEKGNLPGGSESGKQNYVFLHELCKHTMDLKELTDQLLNILLAGRDTTASLLSMQFFLLARRPDVWERLTVEVSTLNGQIPNYEQLRGLEYLNWVLQETLRLYPVVPSNSRMANKDTFLPVGGGPDGKSPVFVAKGQEVIYDVFSMHRRRDIYGEDAEEYKPERWESLRPGWAYLPFNGGPRICIGQQFALTEAGYTIVRILQHFRGIESHDPEPWQELLALTVASKNGAKVALIPS